MFGGLLLIGGLVSMSFGQIADEPIGKAIGSTMIILGFSVLLLSGTNYVEVEKNDKSFKAWNRRGGKG